jgi:hypothetical protein
MMTMFFWLLVGHALADYPLQGDYLAVGKDRHSALNLQVRVWPHCLLSHAIIHGGGVALVTGSVLLGVFEIAIHAAIDFGKCEKWYGYHTDQVLHVICKVAWAIFAVQMAA